MKSLFFLLISIVLLNASSLGLKKILEELGSEHPLSNSIKAYADAYEAQARAQTSRKALQLSLKTAYAKSENEASEQEYSLGLQQKFMNPNVKQNRLKSISYQNDAKVLELKHTFLRLENDVRLLYHLSCLDQKTVKEYHNSYLAFKTLYAKKEKAYSYGEISKKEFLQLHIELDRLKNEYKHYKNEADISRQDLETKLLLVSIEGEELLCTDMYKVTKELSFRQSDTSLKEESLNKKIQSAQSDLKRYDTLFDSFTLMASYEEEIDTNRVTFGLFLPLNFTSSINEEKRAAALYRKSAFEYEKKGLKEQISSEADGLKKTLTQNFEDIEAYTSMLKQYEDELMPLIERGYRLGEDSAIEYLLSQREVWKLKKELIQDYKNYYATLFKLYSVLEIKE